MDVIVTASKLETGDHTPITACDKWPNCPERTLIRGRAIGCNCQPNNDLQKDTEARDGST
jgi:hypothetical protein